MRGATTSARGCPGVHHTGGTSSTGVPSAQGGMHIGPIKELFFPPRNPEGGGGISGCTCHWSVVHANAHIRASKLVDEGIDPQCPHHGQFVQQRSTRKRNDDD